MTKLHSKYGPSALITGASSGIGAEFAHQLAGAGFDLILVARRRQKLEVLAAELRTQFGVQVDIVGLDLSQTGAVDELVKQTGGYDVGLVVNCAGVFTVGPFIGNDAKDEADLVTLNVLVPMQLAHHFGRKLAQMQRGGIILVASTVGHQAAPYLANYAATKAYVATLGQALNYELKGSGVTVQVLSPGPTHTEGVEEAAGIDFGALPLPMMAPKRVVAKSLKRLGRRALVVPGPVNKVMDVMGKYLTPRPVLTRMFGFLLSRALDEKPNQGTHRISA